MQASAIGRGADAVAPGALRRVQGAVGGEQEAAPVAGIGGERGHADGAAHAGASSAVARQLADGAADPLGDIDRIVTVRCAAG